MMIVPRGWIPKPETIDPFSARITEAIEKSRPVIMPNVLGLFEKQTLKQKRASGHKAAASKMGIQFAKRLQFRKDTI
jgi:hypothetical protein